MEGYRIDELAQAAGTTVRNVRAYQDRGLLPAPERSGRVAIYREVHLVRLRLIGALLERGYTLSNIAELLAAWEHGRDVGDVLGLEAALASPFSDEAPDYVTAEELAELFGEDAGPEALAEAERLGFLEAEGEPAGEGAGERFRVPSPRLLHAGAELVRAGVPLAEVFELADGLRADTRRIARRFVETVATHVFGPYGGELPPSSDLPALAEVVRRLRPLARMAVEAELATALEREAHAQLGEHLARVLEHIDSGRGREAS